MAGSRTATGSSDDGEVFEFNLNTVQAETELRPFRFMWASKQNPNRRFTMQHIAGLNVWPLLAGADGGDASAMMAAFETALGEDQWEDFQKSPLPQYKMEALFKAYRKHCGTDPGESPASSDS
ncbi:hypothetical protein [Streptomyces scabiei]|uniref:hypothetical protein n=1 Tax=Streptomyces scabiei TaxID=1930 RepID=UPI0029B4A66C|nr:hypothetical protein [Streptomyces scabiei]MDX3199959.1 hypothetical protein [Streptomyces scabiei]MDX3217753.1 hypothetical protein [Streptomyces scabiei]